MGACDRAVDELRRELNKPSSFEFHFSHVSEKIRRKFLERVSHEDFRYAGFVVDKRKLYGERFKDPKQFYEFSVGIVCENVKQLLTDAKIIIDQSGNRTFRQQLAKSLKTQLTDKDGTCRVKKVTMESSHSNNLLQVADMICGAVTRSHTALTPAFLGWLKREKSLLRGGRNRSTKEETRQPIPSVGERRP